MNSSNKQILTTLEKQVNEFGKTALDRSFVDAYKSMQEKITEMQFQTIMTPVKESEQAQKTMQAKIQSLYAEFTNLYNSQFENLNEANKNTLIQIAEQAKKTSKSLFDRLLESLSGFIDKAVNKDLGKSVVESPAKGAENLMGSMLDISKDVMKSFGPWGAIAAATLDFAIGIFEGLEQQRIKEIEERRDKDLKELEKQSEIALLKLEEGFDAEINMRKEKLSKLDDEYTKEIEFLKQAQSKGQISGEEFQKRLSDVQKEYKTKRDKETTQITETENAKKLEVERKKKLSSLEADQIKAQAEVDKIENSNKLFYWSKDADLKKAQQILDEILKRIAKVKSAGSIEELKLARGGARFVSNRPTYMPNSGVMSSEFGQSELIRITPAPIDENLRKLEAKIIAEEVVRLQKSERNTMINNYYYNFNGDVFDAEKLVRMLKSKEHLMGFRMAE